MSMEFTDIDKKIKVVNIHIQGQKRTDADYFKHKIDQIYHSQNIIELSKNCDLLTVSILKDGVFSDVQFLFDTNQDTKFSDNSIPVDVHMNVYEKKYFTGEIKSNFESNSKISLTSGLYLNNINGKGSRSSLSLSKSADGLAFNLNYSHPYKNQLYKKGELDVFRKSNSFGNPCTNEDTTGFSLTHTFPSRWNIGFHSLVYEMAFQKIKTTENSQDFSIRKNNDPRLKTSLKHIFLSDGRNDNFFPTEGSMVKISQELCGVNGNFNFFKNRIKAEANIACFNDKRAAFSGVLDAGFILPLSNSDKIYYSDKFFLGGPYNMRGFDTNGIGPNSNGHFLGGELMANIGLHLHMPVPYTYSIPFFRDSFRIHCFANLGSLEALQKPYTRNSFQDLFKRFADEKMRLSYGIGFSVLAMGNIKLELNYSKVLHAASSDRTTPGFSFGFGLDFN